jgi:hypothetical protein
MVNIPARLRTGPTNTSRGMIRFRDELVVRLRRPAPPGKLTFAGGLGFCPAKVLGALVATGSD